jgi:hypothetical protein
MTAAMGRAARVGIGATSGSATTHELEFISCGIAKQEQHIQSDGIRGSRERYSASVVEGTINVGGPLVLEPRPEDLDLILPWILGAAESVDVFDVAEAPLTYGVDIYKIADSFRYAGMRVNTATFSSQPNQPLQLELDVQGTSETAGITFPTIAATLSAKAPYIHHQLTLTLNAVARQCSRISIAINNALILDRFMNSQTRAELPSGDRIVTLSVDVPYGDESNLYDLAVGGIEGTAVYTNGTDTLTFTFGQLQVPARSPIINARGQEIGLTLEFQARNDGTANSIKVTSTDA